MKILSWTLLSIFVATLVYLIVVFSNIGTLNLWGHKTNAIFDFWSLQHLLSGVVLGYIILNKGEENKSLIGFILWILFFAYLWEITELLMELGYLGNKISSWFAGIEFWFNRMLIDPLFVLLGAFMYRKYSRVFIPSLIFVTLFLFLSLSLPNSVYLQTIILDL